MIKTMLFDFGRVISAQKPQSLFQRYEDELCLVRGTINSIMFESPHWQDALVGAIDLSTYWQRIGPELHLKDHERVVAFQRRYYQDEKINGGVHQLLERLADYYQLGIVSNHPPGLKDWLVDWNIDRLFDLVVCSGDLGVAKPDQAIFHLALDRLGAKASETVFIDDTEEHVEAAQAMGIHGIHFTTVEKLRHELEILGVQA